MKKIFLKKNLTEKKELHDGEILDIDIQREIIRELYMNCNNNKKSTLIIKELKKKISGYKGQDNTKKLFNNEKFITLERIYEQLIESKHKCYYCKKDVKIIYNNIREPTQWTLDRIDNDMGHNNDNCVICCLKCNLDRKVTNSNKFKFTKQMKINKLS